jgi:hypothetical protein
MSSVEVERALGKQAARLGKQMQAEENSRADRLKMQELSVQNIDQLHTKVQNTLASFHKVADRQQDQVDHILDSLKNLTVHHKHRKQGVEKRLKMNLASQEKRLEKEFQSAESKGSVGSSKSTGSEKKMRLAREYMSVDDDDIPDYPFLWEDISDNTLLGRFVTSVAFDSLCSIVIVANAAFIGYASQYAADHYYLPDSEQSSTFIDVTEICFLGFYVLELTLKWIVWRCVFFYSEDWYWNWFDFVLVALGVYDLAIATFETGSSGGGTNLTWMRLLRLLKMMKMLRVIRVMRAFQELRLIMYSIIGSFRSLMWSLMMLLLLMYIFGLCLLQGVTAWLEDDAKKVRENEPGYAPISQSLKDEVHEYWGSVSKAMLTCYMTVTGGLDWDPVAKVLEKSGKVYFYVFLFYIVFITFAVFNVITGLFVDKARAVAGKDKVVVLQEERASNSSALYGVREWFANLEAKEGAGVKRKAFREALKEEEAYQILQNADIEYWEAVETFRVLSGHYNHKVSVDAFVDGVTQVKGQGTSMQMLTLMFKSKQYMNLMPDLMAYVEECFNDIWTMWKGEGAPLQSKVRSLTMRVDEANRTPYLRAQNPRGKSFRNAQESLSQVVPSDQAAAPSSKDSPQPTSMGAG